MGGSGGRRRLRDVPVCEIDTGHGPVREAGFDVTNRILIAGIGNIFLGDDGFGVAVAARLAEEPWPEHVRVEDFGIRGLHLAYEMLNGYETTILVDTAA